MNGEPGAILLVDDSADDLYLTVRALRQGHITNEIVQARDGIEALVLLHPEDGSEPLRPAIILLDVLMPRMNGLEILTWLRAHASTRSLPVIMLTSSDQDRDMIDNQTGATNRYVPKPVLPQDLLETAKALGVHSLNVATHG